VIEKPGIYRCIWESLRKNYCRPLELTSMRVEFAGSFQKVTHIKSLTLHFVIPKRKSDYTLRNWHDIEERFTTIEHLKFKLLESFPKEHLAPE